MRDRREAKKTNVPDPEQEHIARLIKQLGQKDTFKRKQAERALRSLGSIAVEPLLAAVTREARWRRSRKVFATLLIGLLFTIWKYFHRGFAFIDCLVFAWAIRILGSPKVTIRQRSLVYILSAMNDRRAIGPFAEALDYTFQANMKLRYVARDALIRLLPRLQASDAPLLTANQRDSLRRALSGKDTALTLAILKAFEQIGDAGDLACVEKIDGPDSVMEAAQACLPYLRARIEQQQTRQTLLRASDVASLTRSGLLRPATGSGDIQEQVLLRPVNNGSKETD